MTIVAMVLLYGKEREQLVCMLTINDDERNINGSEIGKHSLIDVQALYFETRLEAP